MKVTVLVVDDEEIIRTGLTRRFPWVRAGVELAGTAASGREALAKLRARPVDIVLTDIVMPGLDGLQLIERARRLPAPPAFVVLSGYGEFAYAQRAMQLGVRRYVLKPTRLPELVRVLGEEAARVRRERCMRTRTARRERLRDAERHLTRAGALAKAITTRHLAATELAAIGGCLGLRHARDALCLVLVRAPSWTAAGVADLEVIGGRIFGTGSVVGAVEVEGGACLVLRCATGAPADDALEDLLARLARAGRAPLHVACTEPTTLARLAGRLAAVGSCLQRSFYLGSRRVVRCPDAPTDYCRRAPPSLETRLRRVDAAVAAADAPGMREALDETFALASEILLDPREVRAACLGLLVGLVDRLGKDAGTPLRSSLPRIADADDADELAAAVRSCLEGIITTLRPFAFSPAQRLVEALQGAVEHRYAERGLSLRKICATQVFTSEDHAGRVFRAATGVRFCEYLADVRMREAKRLLAAFPHMTIAEVARRTGFGDNPQYFSTVFRRHGGMRPNDWRRAASMAPRRSPGSPPPRAAEKRTTIADS